MRRLLGRVEISAVSGMKWLEAHVPTENAPQDYTDMLGRGFSGYREILRLDGAQQREVL